MWRTYFAAIATTAIRVIAERAADGWSRLTEVEAYQDEDGGPVNTAPNVNITNPAEGASALAPANFTVEAAASDAEGPVASVAFYANGILIAQDNTSPFSVPWNDVVAGSYTLTAVATDGGGLTRTSAEVHVTVTNPTAGRVNVAAAAQGCRSRRLELRRVDPRPPVNATGAARVGQRRVHDAPAGVSRHGGDHLSGDGDRRGTSSRSGRLERASDPRLR